MRLWQSGDSERHRAFERGGEFGIEDDDAELRSSGARDRQLTSLGWATNPYGYGFGTPSTISYSYSTGSQSNGQITQVQDQLSGETIVYTYDSLKRLTQAAATPTVGTSPTAWTQNYQFDGFGNLTSKNGVANSIPVVAATNRLSSASYDLNGNMTSGSGATMVYDEANRVSSAAATGGGIEYYGYSADSKRFYKYTSVGTEQLTFFGARGEKLGVYSLASTGSSISPVSTNIWFAGKAIVESNEPAYMDRLGDQSAGLLQRVVRVEQGHGFIRTGRRLPRRRTIMRSLPPIPGMTTPSLIMRTSDIMRVRTEGSILRTVQVHTAVIPLVGIDTLIPAVTPSTASIRAVAIGFTRASFRLVLDS